MEGPTVEIFRRTWRDMAVSNMENWDFEGGPSFLLIVRGPVGEYHKDRTQIKGG